MATVFSERNAASRDRLNGLGAHITDEQLTKSIAAGWTASAILAHLELWDQRALLLLHRWKKDEDVQPSPVDSDVINDAAKALCLAVPPRKALEICLTAAASVDAEIEGLSPAIVAQIESKSTHVRLDRSAHRNEHLEEIEAALSRR